MKKNLKFLIAAFLLLPIIVLLGGCSYTKVNISSAEITLEHETYYYTGEEITPEITVLHKEKVLKLDEHYTVSYINNKNVGTATVVVKGVSKYKGTKNIEFAISEADLANITVTPHQSVFDGTNKTIQFSGLESDDTVLYSLFEDGEFEPTLPEIKTVGEHTVYFKVQRDGYKDFVSSTKINVLPATQNIVWQNLTKPEGKEFFVFEKAYDGEQVEFSFTGQAKGTEVFYSTDNKQTFTQNFPEIKDAGSYTVFVVLLNDNYHAVEIEARIEVLSLSGLNVTFSGLLQTYNGTEKTVELNTLTDGSTIKYSLENNGEYNLTELPKFINAGVYNIYYQVSKPNYEDTEGQVVLTINKATPSLYGTTATDLTYGQNVGESVISFNSETEGVAKWINPDVVPNASDEKQQFFFTFTPDNPNYITLSYGVFVKVSKATPNVLFDYDKHTLYNNFDTPTIWLLPENQVDGSIAFDDEKVVVGTREYGWTFTPNNENYNTVKGFVEFEVLGGEITDVWLFNYPHTTMYMAFEKFDTSGLEFAYTVIENSETREEYTTEFGKIIYQSAERDCFIVGDEYVVVEYAGFEVTIYGIYVEKVYPEITVEYVGPESYTPNMEFDESYIEFSSTALGTMEFYANDISEGGNEVCYVFIPEDTENYEIINGYVYFYIEKENPIIEFKINGETVEVERYENNYYYLENNDNNEVFLNFDSSRFVISLRYYYQGREVILDLEPNVVSVLNANVRAIALEVYTIDGDYYEGYYIDFVKSKTIRNFYVENEDGEAYRAYTDINYNQEIVGFDYYYYDTSVITTFLYEMDDKYDVVIMQNGEVFEINKLKIGKNYLTLQVYNKQGEFVEEKSLKLEYYPSDIFQNIHLSFSEEDFIEGYSNLVYYEEGSLSVAIELKKSEQGRIFSGNENLVLTVYNEHNEIVNEPFELSYPLKPLKLKVQAVYKGIYEFEIPVYVSQDGYQYLDYYIEYPYAEFNGEFFEFSKSTGSLFFNPQDNNIPAKYSNQEIFDNLYFNVSGDAAINGIYFVKEFEESTERIFLNVYEYEDLVLIAEFVLNKFGTIDNNTNVRYDGYTIFDETQNALLTETIYTHVGSEFYIYAENEIATLEIILENESGIEFGYENESVILMQTGEYIVKIRVLASDGETEKVYSVTFIVEEIEPFVVLELLNGETYTLELDITSLSFGDFQMIDSDEAIVYVYAALGMDNINSYMQDGEFVAQFVSINPIGSVIVGNEIFNNPAQAHLEVVDYDGLTYYQFTYQFEIVDGETLYVVAMFTFVELEEAFKIGYSYYDEQNNLVNGEEVLRFDRESQMLIGDLTSYFAYADEGYEKTYILDLRNKIALDENNQAALTLTVFENYSIVLINLETFEPDALLKNVESVEETILFVESEMGMMSFMGLAMFPIESLEDFAGDEPPESYDMNLLATLYIIA